MITICGEANAFIKNIIKGMIRAADYKAALYDSHLYVLSYNGIFYSIDLTGKIDPNLIGSFTSESIKQYDEYIMIDNDGSDDSILSEVLLKYRMINFHKVYGTNELYDYNVRDDTNFEAIMSAKASDGAFKYFIRLNTGNMVFIVLNRSIFNLTKADKAKLNIYYDKTNQIYIASFSIYRNNINEIFNIDFIFKCDI